MNTRKRDAESTKSAILDAAEALFLEHGVARVSLSQLATAAGVTKSLIHHHFGSKDQLWVAVKQRFFAEYTDAQKQMLANSEPTVDLLKHSMTTYFRYLNSKPNFARLNSMMMLEGDRSCETMFREIIDSGTEAIRGAQERGDIRADLNPDHILITGLSMVENWFLGRDRFIEAHFRNMSEEDRNAHNFDECYLQDMLRIYLEGLQVPNNS